MRLAGRIHGFNFQLWHEEDDAREAGAADAVIGQVKKRIDPLNQQRNDAIEALDEWLVERLVQAGAAGADAPLHSETVGTIVDRLSILTLKIFHMAEQTGREDATPEHRRQCEAKLAVLTEQRTDLALALGSLLEELSDGRKRLKVYRQMKMYNDPSLNPALYGRKG